MSSFGGLSTALSGLMTQRRAVEVTGQNIANASTPGYVRQRAEMAALGGAAVPSMFSTPAVVGQGVAVVGVNRLNDLFLDARARTEGGVLAAATQEAATMSRLESLLAEPGDSGLSAQMAQFWSSWSTVGNEPDSIAARSELLERGSTLVRTLADASAAVDSQWGAGRDQAVALAAEVTAAAASIAQLNGTIRQHTVVGVPANELLDQRDQLLSRVVELTGAAVRPGPDGVVDVTLGGVPLVTGSRADRAEVTGAVGMGGVAADPVRLVVGGTPTTAPSGQLSAVLGALNTHLPTASAGFDGVAATLADAVNTVHRQGKGLTPHDGGGQDFFSGSTARTIAVALTDPRQVAAAGGGEGALGSSNADAMAQLASAADGPGAAWNRLVVQMGVASQGAARRAGVQEVVARTAESARESASGVSIDEEMTQLVAYQRAYEGNARVISAIDEMLDVLVNRTGTVGR